MDKGANATHQAAGVPTIAADAPRVRLTTGAGSSSQKTWNVRRTVLLIGSRRTAHLRLDHHDISKAHALLLNACGNVLLRDLCSRTGTWRNDRQIDLTLLSDGDVLRLGPVSVQVAIQSSSKGAEDTETELTYQDPTCLPQPLRLQPAGDGPAFELARAISVIGRRDGCEVCLNDETVSQAHAVIFHTDDGPAIMDLGSRNGVWVNEQRVEYAGLGDGDLLRIGAVQWQVRVESSADPGGEEAGEVREEQGEPSNGRETAEPLKEASAVSTESPRSTEQTKAHGHLVTPPMPPNAESVLGDIEQRIATLQSNINESWQQLNAWQAELEGRESQLRQRAEEFERLGKEIEGRAAELDGRQGQLDRRDAEQQQALAELEARKTEIEQFEGKCQAQREELEALVAKTQQAQAEFHQKQKEFEQRQAEIDKSTQELTARQQALEAEAAAMAERQAKIEQSAEALEGERRRVEEVKSALAEKQNALEAGQRELETARGQLDEQREQLDAGEQQFESQRQSFEERRKEFEKTLAQLKERESAISAFRDAMARVNEVFDQPAVTAPKAPQPPEAPPAAKQSVPPAKEGKAPKPAPRPVETGPQTEKVQSEKQAARPKGASPSAAQPPVPDGIDAETADRLRMLRRLGAKGNDEDLIRQIETERQQVDKKKRSWWRRGS